MGIMTYAILACGTMPMAPLGAIGQAHNSTCILQAMHEHSHLQLNMHMQMHMQVQDRYGDACGYAHAHAHG